LEGLEISILNLSYIKNDESFGRLDAEYFGKEFLFKEKEIKSKNYKNLRDLADITDGEHGSPDLDENSGIIYLSGNNIKENTIDFENVRHCSLKLHQKNLRSSVKQGSVLMSIVGSVGRSSVVYKNVLANTDRNVATIKNISIEINPYWLSTFLNSKFVVFQTQRFSTGNVQPLLNLLQIKSIIVPLLSQDFQSQTESLIKQAHAKLGESKTKVDPIVQTNICLV
jgi:type I restriction enzyme S subunit